jgi:hypothetical protein
MSLFNKTEVDTSLIPLINEARAVGKVKVKNMGECSVQITDHDLLLKKYEGGQPFAVPLESIKFVNFDSGNFFVEPKIVISTQNNPLELHGVDNNDIELERFFATLRNITRPNPNMNRPNPNPNMHQGMPQPNRGVNQRQGMPMPNGPNNIKPNQPINNNQQPIPNQPQNRDQPNVQNNNIDPIEEIKRYYQLKEDGILTEEEFNKKKEELLKQ